MVASDTSAGETERTAFRQQSSPRRNSQHFWKGARKGYAQGVVFASPFMMFFGAYGAAVAHRFSVVFGVSIISLALIGLTAGIAVLQQERTRGD